MCHDDTPATAAAADPVQVETRHGDAMPVLVTAPAEPLGAIALIPDYFGPSPFYRELAARLAREGLAVAVTDPYFRLPPVAFGDRAAAVARLTELPDERALADTRDVVAWLRLRYGAPRVGVMGFCAGGTWALCTAADSPEVAAVSFYGFPAGLPGDPRHRRRPADEVGGIRAPVLALWGSDDDAVGRGVVEDYRRAAADRAEVAVYHGVGHGFLRGLTAAPGHERQVAEQAWERALAFLRTRLLRPIT